MRNKQNKNRPTLRRSQTVTTFGVGAIADLPDASVMICGTDKWDTRGSVSLSDPRLEKKLGVSYFRMAPDSDSPGDGITAVRFPRAMRCRRCNKLRDIEAWRIAAQSTKRFIYFDDKPYCDTCSIALIPSRFVVACRKGHIDDFPFVEWAHGGKEKICTEPKIEYREIGASASLGSIRITCSNCNESRSMGGSFSKETLENISKCKGAMPWEMEYESECRERLTTLQRGGTNVHFPSLKSSILIPPHSSQNLKTKITESLAWELYISQQGALDSTMAIQLIANELQEDLKKVEAIFNEINGEPEESPELKSEEEYRYEEYLAFKGEYDQSTSDPRDFLIEEKNVSEYNLPFLKSLVLVKKLRELRVQTGFSRIRPPQQNEEDSSDDDELIETMPVSQKRQNWLPAYEVRGEGIFIEFKPEDLKSWANQDLVKSHLASLISRSKKNPDAFGVVSELIPEFILLHTLSHIMIKQLSFECGYSSSALRERMYVSNRLGKEMYGFLIYTADGDADGTLGGLVRQGEPDLFVDTMLKALNESQWCSSDPLCIESKGQGYLALNLAACHSCCMLPETSCELINRYLDRTTLIGSLSNPEIGLFTSTLKELV